MKWIYRLMVGLAFLEVIYLVATTIFLNGNGLRSLLNTNPDEILFDWERAISPFPGFVMIKGITGRIQDSGMQLHFKIPSVHVGVWLPALRHREFVTTSIRGTGVAFRLRLRRSLKEIRPEHYRALPPIPGLPSVEKSTAPDMPRMKEPWHIRLGGIALDHLEEIWIEEYRYVGNLSVNGGFTLMPGKLVDVYPSEVKSHSGELFLAGNKIADNIALTAQGKIPDFATNEPERNIINSFTGSVEGETRIDNMRFLNYYLREVAWLHLDGGTGKLSLNVGLREGEFTDKSFLQLVSNNIEAHLWRQIARGNGTTLWHVENAKQQRISLNVRLLGYEVTHSLHENSKITGKDLRVRVSSSDLRVDGGFKGLGVSILIPPAQITSLRYFNAYLPTSSGLRFLDGAGSVEGEIQAEVGHNNDRGHLLIRGTGAKIHYGKFNLEGDVNVLAKLNSGSIEKRMFDVHGTKVDLNNLVAREGGKNVKDVQAWWGSAEVQEGKLFVGKPAQVKGRLTVEGRDARPLLALFTSDGGLPGLIRDVLTFDGLTASADLFLSDKRLIVDDLEVIGKGMSIRGWLNKGLQRRRGGVLLSLGPFAAGLELNDQGASIKLNDAYRWYETSEARRGTLSPNDPIGGTIRIE